MKEGREQISGVEAEQIQARAEEFYDFIISSFNQIIEETDYEYDGRNHLIFGSEKNFLSLMGIGTERLHLVIGKKPVLSKKGHLHIDLPQLLKKEKVEITEEEQETSDPNAFDSWEAVIGIGENPVITFSSHTWRSGDKKDEKVHFSPSGGIQTNNQAAIAGVESLLPHIKLNKAQRKLHQSSM